MLKMRLCFPYDTKSKAKNTVLFVCVENAGRSQMAEAFFKKYAPGSYEAASAGTKHTSEINSHVVKSMSQIGIDISKQKPKELSDDLIRNAVKIINMGCMDNKFCPTLFIPKVVDWDIEDPKGKPLEKIAEIRDEIEQRIKELIDGLNGENKER
jgi:protein-tyrosine-phosphatase